jgi:heme/copper-type cytochrome/quinol oxidase subunit 2
MSLHKKLSSSKQEAKIAVIFMWSFLLTFPVITICSHQIKDVYELTPMILFISLVILACTGIMMGSLVTFLIWFYRAYSNLHEKAPNLKRKRYWAILGWVIPIVNLYLPYLIIKEMYANIAILTNNPSAQESIKKWTTINLWWTLYILGWILDIVYYISIYPKTSVIFDVVTYILIVPSVWLTVKIIQDYCRFEEQLSD